MTERAYDRPGQFRDNFQADARPDTFARENWQIVEVILLSDWLRRNQCSHRIVLGPGGKRIVPLEIYNFINLQKNLPNVRIHKFQKVLVH